MAKYNDPAWKKDFLKTQLKKELSRKEPSALALDYYSGKITYVEYLQSEHWKTIRNAKLEKTNKTCEVCGEDGVRLDIHHKNYETLGHESIEDLAALCPYCHEDVHKVIKELKGKDFKQMIHCIAAEYFIPNLINRVSQKTVRVRKELNTTSVPARTSKRKPKRRTRRRVTKK